MTSYMNGEKASLCLTLNTIGAPKNDNSRQFTLIGSDNWKFLMGQAYRLGIFV